MFQDSGQTVKEKQEKHLKRETVPFQMFYFASAFSACEEGFFPIRRNSHRASR